MYSNKAHVHDNVSIHIYGHVHEELSPMLQIEKPSKSYFWDKLITNRVISKKIGENLCFNGRAGVRRLKLI